MRKKKDFLEQRNSYWLVCIGNEDIEPFEVHTVSWRGQTKAQPVYWNNRRLSVSYGVPSVYYTKKGLEGDGESYTLWSGVCFLCYTKEDAIRIKEAFFISEKLRAMIFAKWHKMDLNALKGAYENLKKI